MQKQYLLSCFLLGFSSIVTAQQWDNYKPDNSKIKLTETNLPILYINTNNKVIDRENRIEADMVLIDNGMNQLNYSDTLKYPGQRIDYRGKIGLKYRGNSSFTMSDKKPYSIRPQNNAGKKQEVSLLGMGKDSDWALLAPFSDKSMIRDMLSFTLAAPYFEYVPTGHYCELILDNTYYGVYILSERVRKGKERLNISSPGDSGDALTGGYHLEVDRDDETVYQSRHTPVNTKGSVMYGKKISFQYKAPEYEDLTSAQLSFIHGRIDEFENALASADYTDPQTGYRKYIDVTSFIDYMLSTEFCHNVDGYRLSTNLYKYADSVDPRFKMSLWDLNLGFGNADYANGWRTDTWAYEFNDVNPSDNQLVPFWWYRLLKDPVFMKEVKTRWTHYRETAYSDQNIAHTIDSLTNLLNVNGAQQRNFQAWPRWNRYVWPNKYVASSYGDELAYLKDWIEKRLVFMDNALLLPKDPSAIGEGFESNLTVYPNPVTTQQSLQIEGEGIESVRLVLPTGQLIYQQNVMETGRTTIPMHGYSSGVYLLIVKQEERSDIHKIIVR